MDFWLRTDEPYLCDIIYKSDSGERSYVFANPYTGKIQGEAKLTFQRFFRDLHYFLFIPFQIGHFTVLIFGFLLLLSLITALVFYKTWWRKLFELHTGKGALVFFRSLHRLIGLWSVLFTLLFSITGIWYFMERTNIAGISTISNPKKPRVTTAVSFENGDSEDMDFSDIDYNRAVAEAERAIPGLRAGDILPPKSKTDVIYISGEGKVPLVRQRANRVYLDPTTYKPIKVQDARDIGTTMYINDIADPLHFGYWGGLVTKIIWFFLGLGISSLVLSGIWIRAKRKATQRKAKKQSVMGIWHYINWGVCSIFWFFMYYILIDRYRVSGSALLVITAGWIIFLATAYYLFVIRLKRVIASAI